MPKGTQRGSEKSILPLLYSAHARDHNVTPSLQLQGHEIFFFFFSFSLQRNVELALETAVGRG